VTERLPNPSCVLKVGEGRGFVVEYRVKPRYPAEVRRQAHQQHMKLLRGFATHRVVVTAAHCLPKLPPAHAAALWQERTYGQLLGRLDCSKTEVCAECLFVDPVADIAVLGCPDGQELYKEAEAYEALTDNAPALPIRKVRNGKGWLLSLAGQWIRTTLEISGIEGRGLSIGPTKDGMSGSPILNDAGRAVGVVAVANGSEPILMRNLPGWLLPLQR
jgi:hypothetical protein